MGCIFFKNENSDLILFWCGQLWAGRFGILKLKMLHKTSTGKQHIDFAPDVFQEITLKLKSLASEDKGEKKITYNMKK